MRYLKLLTFFVCLNVYCGVSAQEAKKAMTFEEMVGWKRITEKTISNDGKWVACKMEPWRGDASIFVYNSKGEQTASFQPAAHAEFSVSSNYLLVTKKPELERVEALKLKKAKEEEMPLDELVIFHLSGERETIDSLKSYKLSESADWIAYKRNSKSDSTLHVRSLDGTKEVQFADAKEFNFAKKRISYIIQPTHACVLIPRKKKVLSYLKEKACSKKRHSMKPAIRSHSFIVRIKTRPVRNSPFTCRKTMHLPVWLLNVIGILCRPVG